MLKTGLMAVFVFFFIFVAAGLPARAADSPGIFVFSEQNNETTYNKWAEQGYVLKKILYDYLDRVHNTRTEVWII